MKRIRFEDKGQDILWFLIDSNGFVQDAGPSQKLAWEGAYIPEDLLEVGRPCPIHHPPFLVFTWLKYVVESIEEE